MNLSRAIALAFSLLILSAAGALGQTCGRNAMEGILPTGLIEYRVGLGTDILCGYQKFSGPVEPGLRYRTLAVSGSMAIQEYTSNPCAANCVLGLPTGYASSGSVYSGWEFLGYYVWSASLVPDQYLGGNVWRYRAAVSGHATAPGAEFSPHLIVDVGPLKGNAFYVRLYAGDTIDLLACPDHQGYYRAFVGS